MVINHRYQFLFIHVPKNAGSTISKVLSEARETELIHPPHMKMAKAIEMYPEATKYFKIGCVRNPYDRIVSGYHFFKRSLKYSEEAESLDEYRTFKQFMYKIKENPEIINQKRLLNRSFDFLSVDGKVDVDILIRFENIKNDIKSIQEQFGLKRYVGVRNATVHKPYREIHDKETIDITYNIYKKDFEEFGYDRRI
tara:strand:- start:61 stop:648 length:588 start_codon:yes stop_codon:yes gene_type:complete